MQHRNRRQAAIEQQQEFQGLAASTKRQVGSPLLHIQALSLGMFPDAIHVSLSVAWPVQGAAVFVSRSRALVNTRSCPVMA